MHGYVGMAMHACLMYECKQTSDLDERCYERAEWRNRVQNGVKDFEKRHEERLEQKRAIRHRDVTTTATQAQFGSQQNGRDCLLRIGLLSHERAHAR